MGLNYLYIPTYVCIISCWNYFSSVSIGKLVHVQAIQYASYTFIPTEVQFNPTKVQYAPIPSKGGILIRLNHPKRICHLISSSTDPHQSLSI